LTGLKIGVLKGEIKLKEKVKDSGDDSTMKIVIVIMFFVLLYGLKTFIMSA
tara:strand:- start:81 stop:233 length:153 start_codon:yes stop_codon:yes gene_type:complete